MSADAQAPKAIVAGGAGGIGQAIVGRLAERGYEVTAADLPGGDAEERALSAGASRFVGADLATAAGATEAVEAAAAGSGLHALVNSQGIAPKVDGEKARSTRSRSRSGIRSWP
jgi:NAD(P)-dependent dehydrogenase (short-subunit alcohol dehydrogenase family)